MQKIDTLEGLNHQLTVRLNGLEAESRQLQERYSEIEAKYARLHQAIVDARGALERLAVVAELDRPKGTDRK
jgi:prefoldin subunit 5